MQSGAVGACWAHNPEADGSKPSSARSLFHKCCLAQQLLPSSSLGTLTLLYSLPLPAGTAHRWLWSSSHSFPHETLCIMGTQDFLNSLQAAQSPASQCVLDSKTIVCPNLFAAVTIYRVIQDQGPAGIPKGHCTG